MPKFAITYTTSTFAAKLPEFIIADHYRLSGKFFVFYVDDKEEFRPSTVVHQLAASTVLHIETQDEGEAG